MDGYPLNLILALATASVTVFLGFLPTKSIRVVFFARETIKAAIAWALVAVASPSMIAQYPIFFAILCGCSWWKFSRDRGLGGKMWLSIASGLGISIGVMLILAVTPQAYPQNLPQIDEALLLASIYLGGSSIGLAYVSFVLLQNSSTEPGITRALIQRYIGLLVALVVARAGVLAAELFGTGPSVYHRVWGAKGVLFSHLPAHLYYFSPAPFVAAAMALLLLLAFLAFGAIRAQARLQASYALIGVCLVGFATEILLRFLVI